MKGHLVRSKSQWTAEGEKPTKYFCALEHKKYVDKTIKKLVLNNGQIIPTQKEVLHNVRLFYANLFFNRDHELLNINLHEMFLNGNISKLKPYESKHLEGALTIQELSNTLKNMKNDKTPGMDGLPAKNVKVF